MMMCLILDTDNNFICVYKDLELVRSVSSETYKNLSLDNLIDIGGETLKKEWRKEL